MRLKQWAKGQGICYKTAREWFHSGKIPNAKQLDTGTILVDEPVIKNNIKERVCIYSRVSNQSRKEELNYQVKRCEDFCTARGYSIDKIYKEIASGMNDNRQQFWLMIESKPTKIVVEHKDRLTRFGFKYLEKLLPSRGCEIIVINRDSEDETDLVKDLVSIITSFCCRIYGLRRGQNKAKKIRESLESETE